MPVHIFNWVLETYPVLSRAGNPKPFPAQQKRIQMGVFTPGNKQGRAQSRKENQFRAPMPAKMALQTLNIPFPYIIGGYIYLSVRCHTMSAKTKRRKEELLHPILLMQLSTQKNHTHTALPVCEGRVRKPVRSTCIWPATFHLSDRLASVRPGH